MPVRKTKLETQRISRGRFCLTVATVSLIVTDLLFAACEAEQVERVSDDGEDDVNDGEEALQSSRLGPISGDLGGDHHNEDEDADDRPHGAPYSKAGALYGVLRHRGRQGTERDVSQGVEEAE